MSEIPLSIIQLLLFDAVFLAICIILLFPLSAQRHASYAIFKRNILGYFNNPAGYVFLCVFVALGSFAAFWPYDFFNSNLANLDQLNVWIPIILLVFIPTITMSIWAEEQRQGTDELLLTIPAGDWDIVIGKYLAAVGIFTISLMVSQLSNFLVLVLLAQGDIDVGLFATTYFGYWMMGLSMLAMGMVASFLTNNLTIGFIVGLLLNAPFVFIEHFGRPISTFSFSEQMFDFSRGVLSLRAVAFFGLLMLIGLYLSVVLIGRRHWYGGKDGQSLFGHYVARSLALLVVLGGLTIFLSKNLAVRVDATSEKISSLSADTKKLVRDISDETTVLVEAFLSADVPEDYAMVKSDLVTKLNELSARGGKSIDVRIYDQIEPFSDEAARAEEQYGIAPVTVTINERGAMRQEPLFLGAAFTCGLEKVVVPFFDRGIPVEYELVRSIVTASRPERRRLGIVNTDVQLFGGFDMQRFTQTPKQAIVTELEKQYEVVQIDPNSKIEEEVDVLLAVQPSSLTQPQLDNFIEVVRKGVPTAIFEDPMPRMLDAPGTSDPKRPPGGGGMMGMGRQPAEPKGNYQALWSLLGIEMLGTGQFPQFNTDVVWQKYNPYNKVRQMSFITPEWLFISPDMPDAENPFPDDNIVTSSMKQLLFLYAGGIRDKGTMGLTFVPIATTSANVGTLDYTSARQSLGQDARLTEFQRKRANEPIVVAAGIFSDPSIIDANANPAEESSEEKSDAEGESGGENDADASSEINVIFVADIDCLAQDFLMVRAQPPGEVAWKFDNVPFVLNVIDTLAKDRSFVEIRKRQTRHSTLKLVEQKTSEASESAETEIQRFEEDFNKAKTEAESKLKESMQEMQSIVDNLNKKQTEGGEEVNRADFIRELNAATQSLGIQQTVQQRRMEIEVQRLERERDRKLKGIQRNLNNEIRKVQNLYKLLAVAIPPIPPLVLGLTVFLRRRSLEQESVTDARRR